MWSFCGSAQEFNGLGWLEGFSDWSGIVAFVGLGCRLWYAAMKLVPGNAHECPVLYELVEQFVRRVGKGVMKLLILDRGFIDGKNISRCKTEWGTDVLIPIKNNMNIWEE